MINSMAKAMAKISVGPNPSYGFGPGAKAGVEEGGPGSGPQGGEHEQDHRGARIYQSGKAFRALTPTGHNVGPYKNADLLKSHLDQNDSSFGLSPKQKQADSATSVGVPQLRAQKKESKKKWIEIKESQDSSLKINGSLYEVILIKEGLGNFRDCFFYTQACLKQAADSGIFNGSQSYADHPTSEEEQIRPERSTRDLLGYYESVEFKTLEGGQGALVANLNISKASSLDWARALLNDSLEYSKKFQESDLVGLSINASGAASPMNIDEFIQSQPDLAPEVLQKLNEAKAQGVSEINVVNELKEAQSVDLVTKAGAGGRILQMLEQEKKMEKKEKNTMENEDGGMPSAADGATPDHADADQDKALIAQMIKQYLGKDSASPEEMEMAQHAHEAAKEMGMEGKEAYETAGQHLKMAMAVGKKMAQKQSKQEGHHEGHEGECKQEGQTPPPSPHEGKKESMKQILELGGEVAKLRESVRRYELRDYLDKKLAESGKSNSVTKKFRETLGTPKSKDQIDGTWKIFISAYEAGAEEVGIEDVFFGEKTSYRESSGSSRKGFLDCLR